MKSQAPQVGDRLSLHIDRLAIGGRGVARHEGFVIFVENVAPDEDVRAEITQVKKNHAEAKYLEVLTPSPHRVQPICPVFGICGGCNWQHIDYAEQLKQKHELVLNALVKFSGFDASVIHVLGVKPSPKPFHYRNRIQLHFAGTKLGFFKRLSHDIVDIDSCPITEDEINAQIAATRLKVTGQSLGRIELSTLAAEGAKVDGRFNQVNTAQNRNLIATVVEKAREIISTPAPAQIWDLYAGGGNFSFPLIENFPQAMITAVELNSDSVASARSRLPENLKHQFVESDVERFLSRHRGERPTLILIDPPRTGCGTEVMKLISEVRPANIFYVSCHPVTLARDLKVLSAVGYRLHPVLPFDMFPQTDHVECFVHLSL